MYRVQSRGAAVSGGHIETPSAQALGALQLLEALEDQLRLPDSCALPREDQVGMLVAARRELALVLPLAGSAGDGTRYYLPRTRRRVGRIFFVMIVFLLRGVAFLVRSTWRCAWGALRLVYILQRI